MAMKQSKPRAIMDRRQDEEQQQTDQARSDHPSQIEALTHATA